MVGYHGRRIIHSITCMVLCEWLNLSQRRDQRATTKTKQNKERQKTELYIHEKKEKKRKKIATISTTTGERGEGCKAKNHFQKFYNVI